MISGPPAAFSPPKKVWRDRRPQACTCSLAYRVMGVLLSLDMQSDSWRGAGQGGWVSGFHSSHVCHMSSIFCSITRWDDAPIVFFCTEQCQDKSCISVSTLAIFLECIAVRTNTDWQTGQTKWIYFPLPSRITGWRLRIWRLFLISSTRRPRTCRTSSQGGDAAAIMMAEPPANYPMTFLPLWWTSLLPPKAFWRG